MSKTGDVTFGDVGDHSLPLAILVHGFPDTPFTWRHLGAALAADGYRVVAPWLPGYDAPAAHPVSVGTYVQMILRTRADHGGDGRTLLVGHDWGANAGYGATVVAPDAFSRYVALAVPPTAAIGGGMFSYAQLRRSFYIWFIQQPGMAEMAFLGPGFWESLWADWSPGYDAESDLAELRRHVAAENISDVLSPYRATFNPDHADPAATDEAMATMASPAIRTLYLHGAGDGAVGAELLTDVADHLPVPGSSFRLVEGAGHFLHLERPDVVYGVISEWLAAD